MPGFKDVSNVSSIILYSKDVLSRYVDAMPNGEYFNNISNRFEKCRAIALQLNGKVCPVYESVILNIPLELEIDRKYRPFLKNFDINSLKNFGNDLDEASRRYNEECIKDKKYGSCIIGYYEF